MLDRIVKEDARLLTPAMERLRPGYERGSPAVELLPRPSTLGGEIMQRFEVQLEDDLTGGPADETVQFMLEGTTYELDLSAQHADDLRRRLASFVEHARRVHHRGGRVRARTAASRERSRQIRAWAEQQGLEVAAHGRLPTEVIERYERAEGEERPPPSREGRRSSARAAGGRRAAEGHSARRKSGTSSSRRHAARSRLLRAQVVCSSWC
jgi:hypothetical protein